MLGALAQKGIQIPTRVLVLLNATYCSMTKEPNFNPVSKAGFTQLCSNFVVAWFCVVWVFFKKENYAKMLGDRYFGLSIWYSHNPTSIYNLKVGSGLCCSCCYVIRISYWIYSSTAFSLSLVYFIQKVCSAEFIFTLGQTKLGVGRDFRASLRLFSVSVLLQWRCREEPFAKENYGVSSMDQVGKISNPAQTNFANF